jgi:hypothetical protein
MALILPPAPIEAPFGSYGWTDWYKKVRDAINDAGNSVDWAIITNKPTTLAGYGITDGQTKLVDSAGLRAALSDETGTGAAVFANTPTLVTPILGAATGTSVSLTGNVSAETLTLSKATNKGIKVDTTTPTYPWHDLLGPVTIRGTGGSDPAFNIYRGGIREHQFNAGNEVFLDFHIPHDYVPGSDLHLHFHWSINGTTRAGAAAGTVTGGTVTWGGEITYAKGHNQAAFGAPVTSTVVSGTTASTLYQHYITEVQISASSPSGSQIDSDDIETDGLLFVRAYLSANNITVSSGSVPAPFLHFVDIHYQSTGIGTKNKAPNFFS